MKTYMVQSCPRRQWASSRNRTPGFSIKRFQYPRQVSGWLCRVVSQPPEYALVPFLTRILQRRRKRRNDEFGRVCSPLGQCDPVRVSRSEVQSIQYGDHAHFLFDPSLGLFRRFELEFFGSRIEIEFSIDKYAASDGDNTRFVYVINNLGPTLFKQMNLRFNGTLMSKQTDMYAYNAFLETVLN